MQRKESLETEEQKVNKSRSVLNILANFAKDPIERLRGRRIRVAAQLSALIATVGVTHAKVALKSGIKPSQLSRQLSGDVNLTLDTISRICDALGTDYDVVFRKSHQAAVKQWWEHDRTSTDHFSAALTEFVMAPAKDGIRTIEFPAKKVTFSMELENIVGRAGVIQYCNNQAENDESKLIAA